MFSMQERVINPPNDMPACSECRRRKLRCSREVPACKECRRLGAVCQYEARDTKPGMKPGAVENLNRRVDHLEKLISQLQQQIEPVARNNEELDYAKSRSNGERGSRTASDLLEAFEKELRKFNSNKPFKNNGTRRENRNASLLGPFTSLRENSPDDYGALNPDGERKRRKLDSTASWVERVLRLDSQIAGFDMTSEEWLESIIEAYFTQVHPWIPMVHQARFKRRLSMEPQDSILEVLLHAMIVAAIRFVELEIVDSVDYILQITKTSRDFVILSAMDSLCVENLQALIIIAFDDIGKGDAEKAWSIVGSLTRTVEYLQLSIESEEVEEQPLLQPCPSLPAPEDWIEVEEQRRVFWNIFNLDRFCSVVTGWNTSLTSDDVHRCLPADGFLWRKGEPVLTPYFGIWDKSAGRIGKSIASLPAQYPSPSQTTEGMHHSSLASTGPEGSAETPGISTIGAFAYCIEATESMSQVTTYFLQQKINLRNPKQIESWLTRFKELDLRLVHWKMFLPQKWKDTKIVSQKSSEVIMDPNLTVAHVTHNASMILLHQLIAYPPADWGWATRLPSRSSADTCQAAATETAIITQNFLASAKISKIFNSQFVFCIYVAARSLLVHWRYYSDPAPLPEFSALIQSLEKISTCWLGRLEAHNSSRTTIAGKYASQLRFLHECCNKNSAFRVDVLGHANEFGKSRRKTVMQSRTNTPNKRSATNNDNQSTSYHDQENYSQAIHVRFPVQHILSSPMSQSDQTASLPATVPQLASYYYGQIPINCGVGDAIADSYPISHPGAAVPNENSAVIGENDLSSISQMFFDQQYIEMDRIISFDDGMFSADMSYGVSVCQ